MSKQSDDDWVRINEALRGSVRRLREMSQSFDNSQLVRPAYPSEWTVADTLSHLGSGAIIVDNLIHGALTGSTNDLDAMKASTWAMWNAKSPDAQRTDALAADRALLDRLAQITPAHRDSLKIRVGPVEFEANDFVRMRLQEHALHVWDIGVTFDPTAVLPTRVVVELIDHLQIVATIGGRPNGALASHHVLTTDPERRFCITVGSDSVGLDPAAEEMDAPVDVSMSSEAFIRLVFGRLDSEHAPPVVGRADALTGLRALFPGL